MPTRKKTIVHGTWVHPADGDDYPTELTMKVTESSALGIISWATLTTGYGEPFEGRRSESTFTFSRGAHHILMATRRPEDGTWARPHAMATDRWGVPDGEITTARNLMHEFFTELGYTRKDVR